MCEEMNRSQYFYLIKIKDRSSMDTSILFDFGLDLFQKIDHQNEIHQNSTHFWGLKDLFD